MRSSLNISTTVSMAAGGGAPESGFLHGMQLEPILGLKESEGSSKPRAPVVLSPPRIHPRLDPSFRSDHRPLIQGDELERVFSSENAFHQVPAGQTIDA